MSTLPKANTRGQCPVCQTVVRFEKVSIECPDTALMRIEGEAVKIHYIPSTGRVSIRNPREQHMAHLGICVCPECGQICIVGEEDKKEALLHPRSVPHRVLPEIVDPEIAKEFAEAARVLPISPKASAALSRRCLELILKKRQIPGSSLAERIRAAEHNLPKELLEMMDMVRQLGNLCAHAQESLHTGEIVDVEPHEADLMLEILDQLANFYYVQPAETEARMARVRAKVDSTKKPKAGQQGPPTRPA